jgi:hypothetical protein
MSDLRASFRAARGAVAFGIALGLSGVLAGCTGEPTSTSGGPATAGTPASPTAGGKVVKGFEDTPAPGTPISGRKATGGFGSGRH